MPPAPETLSNSCSGNRLSQTRLITWVDGVILCGFVLFSLGSFLARWKGINPFVFLGSDAGIVSSFVAAYEHPDLFQGDALLGNFGNFRYYLAIHPLLIYTISKLTGDYGSAYIFLLLFTPLIQASGFYLLGRVLFESRYWALLLSIITICPIALPIREFWGIYDDPLPRSLFHACLPYLLAAAFYFRRNYKMWPWLMAAAGLLFYVHPVSTTPWGFAVWVGMCAFLPNEWGLIKKLSYMFAMGTIFIAVVSPWAANFLHVHDQAGCVGIQYYQVVDIIGDRVGKELLSVGLAIQMWGQEFFSWPMCFYTAWALCAVAVASYLRPNVRTDFLLVAAWGFGILFVTVGVTFTEETICGLYGLPRFQMDSIRGIKYFVPLILLFSLWPLAEVAKKNHLGSLRQACIMFAGAVLVAAWAYQNPPVLFCEAARSWAQGRLMPPISGNEQAIIEAMDAVRKNTPPGSKILPVVLPLETRYSALRPVVYAYKDGGIFADTNYSALLKWAQIKKELEEIAEQKMGPSRKLEILVALASRLGAQYLITDFPIDSALASSVGGKVVWSNNLFALLQCPQATGLTNRNVLNTATSARVTCPSL
ncbi:MAG TPA: hypothetical protein VMC85_05080 [Desulfomonilaceae bacterium]|nr:hypothetical protein [Desulfomonilaceae bacterium]